MKQVIYNKIIWSLAICIFFSCSKNQDGDAVDPGQPQAVNNNKSGGIYKGTIIGSSGNFIIVLQEGIKKIYVTIDGIKDTLSTSASISSGTTISQAVFNGSTGMTLTFSVDANGSNPVVNAISIPGHPFPEAFLYKETTSVSVMVFEGRFTAPASCQSGVLNIIIKSDGTVTGFHRTDNGNHAATLSSTLTGDQFGFTAQSAIVNCSVNAARTQITGAGIDPPCSSTITCNRTL